MKNADPHNRVWEMFTGISGYPVSATVYRPVGSPVGRVFNLDELYEGSKRLSPGWYLTQGKARGEAGTYDLFIEITKSN